jgi:hypothetical protein
MKSRKPLEILISLRTNPSSNTWAGLQNLQGRTKHYIRYERIDYNPTTFSDNPVSLVHLSNASAEAMKAVRDEIESPDFTDAKKSRA